MYKTLLPVFAALLINTGARSQSQAIATKIAYQKTQQSVASIQLPYKTGAVEDAVREYMAKKGYKSSSARGFIVFRGVRLNDADTALGDLYFKVDRSHNDKAITVVSLLPAGSNEDLLTRSQTDDDKIEKAKTFLDKMAPFIDAHNVQLQINSQGKEYKKSQDKMDKLVNNQTDLEKKIRKIQENLDENKSDQAKQNADIQANVNMDADTKQKLQRKMRKLLDNQGDLEKKLRNTQADLGQNKTDQKTQQLEVDKQKQVLEAVQARQK